MSVSSPYGTLAMALQAKDPSGALYRLRNGTFSISGPASATASTEDDPSAESLDVDLHAGDYSVTLEPGWFLERDMGGGTFARADATLVSPDSQSFVIVKRKTTNVVFRFETTSGPVELGGNLSLSIDVEEAEPAPPCTWIGQVDQPVFTDLGDLDGSYTSTLKVSDDGQTVISSTSSSSHRWTEAEGLIELPTPEIPISSPRLVNCDGSVMANSEEIWTRRDGVHPLIGCTDAGRFWLADAMSEAGDVLAGTCSWEDDLYNVTFTPARQVGFDGPAATLPGFVKQGDALDVSADGEVFAGLDDEGTAFRWSEAAGTEEVATPHGGDIRLSGDGRCVFALAWAVDLVVRWCDGVTTSIPVPSLQMPKFLPSYDGTVLIVSDEPNTWLWREGNDSVEPLRNALENAGVDLHDWGVLDVWDMTPDARVFVGIAPHATDPSHKAAFRLVMPRHW